MATHRLDAILADDYLAGLTALPIEELRRRRSDCQEVEVSLSYLRRVVQGRLDIVLAELRHRREGTSHDLQTLVDELPAILSEKVHAGGYGRLSQLMSPGDEPGVDDALLARIDAVADDRRLADLSLLTDADLDALIDDLQSMEADVSAQRRAIHERIDALQAELVRRYKTGEANVNTLLS